MHLAAPGILIPTIGIDHDEHYLEEHGTSMAVPHVTGTLALMMAEFPDKPYKFYIDKLLGSIDKIPSLDRRVSSGGRLNLFKALEQNGEDNCWVDRTIKWARGLFR